jgi:hypothetical protein
VPIVALCEKADVIIDPQGAGERGANLAAFAFLDTNEFRGGFAAVRYKAPAAYTVIRLDGARSITKPLSGVGTLVS